MKPPPACDSSAGLIEKITDWSGRNPFMIGLLMLAAVCGGIYALSRVALDAVPDLSDAQVIVYTTWEGRSPALVEDQITYPITSRFHDGEVLRLCDFRGRHRHLLGALSRVGISKRRP
jgi:Cu(I)/Ag(I) efflux system membrane protein CusA/SilA